VAELESHIRAADAAHAESVAELRAKVESQERRAKKSEANNEYLAKVLETETNAKKEAECKIQELRADLRTKQDVFDAEIAKMKSTHENQILQLGSERMGGGQTTLLRAKIVSLQDELAELKKGISDKKIELTANADDFKSMMPPYPSRFSDDANVGSKRRYEPVPSIKVSAGHIIQKGRKMSAWD
jgi:3-dehydroquinate dehydratase